MGESPWKFESSRPHHTVRSGPQECERPQSSHPAWLSSAAFSRARSMNFKQRRTLIAQLCLGTRPPSLAPIILTAVGEVQEMPRYRRCSPHDSGSGLLISLGTVRCSGCFPSTNAGRRRACRQSLVHARAPSDAGGSRSIGLPQIGLPHGDGSGRRQSPQQPGPASPVIVRPSIDG